MSKNSIVVLGGYDNSDYDLLQKVAKTHKSVNGWGCTKDTHRGDELWFYIQAPISGIVAVGEAMNHAEEGKKHGSNWRYVTKVGRIRWIEPHITAAELRAMFPKWPWPRYTRGKTYLGEDKAVALRMRISEGRSEIDPATTSQLKRGAGFGDPKQNSKVEKASVRYVATLYKKRGYRVSSCEQDKCGYDLIARKRSDELHIEVKGITGSVPEFVITSNEVRFSKEDASSRVVVVVNALQRSRRAIEMTGKAFHADYDLRPLVYVARQKRRQSEE